MAISNATSTRDVSELDGRHRACFLRSKSVAYERGLERSDRVADDRLHPVALANFLELRMSVT